MPVPPDRPDTLLRFGLFEVDLRSGELRKQGRRIKLQEQPFRVLATLLQHPGELVSREDLRSQLWRSDTFVDFDNGLNASINKLREALGDSADRPRWIETVPRRGYRFIASVEGPGSSPTSIGPGPLPVTFMERGVAGAGAAKWHKIGVAMGLVAALMVLAAAGYGIYSLLKARRPAPFESFTITQVTNNAKTIAAAISPDGKYVLSVLDDHGKQSLWLRHVQTNSDAQVIPPAAAFYQSLAFSPDGNYFYFRKANDIARTSYNLLRAPVLGGTPQLIVRDVDSAISFSPGGARIVYVRANEPEPAKFQVLTASGDGSDEKFVSGGNITTYPQFVSWSPDGKKFASLPPGPGGALSAIQFQDVASAKVEALVPFYRTPLHDLAWLPEGRGILVTYQNNPGSSARVQIGFLSGSAAQLRTVTNDTNSYQTLTLSADGKTIATVQQKATQTLYLLPNTGFAGVPPNPALAQHKDALLFGWAGNGDLYFDDGSELLQMSPDGSNETTVLSDPAAVMLAANRCPDGRHVLVEWAGRGGTNKLNIWRVNADGSNPKQLSHGGFDVAPVCAPDGKWAYYKDFVSFQVMRVPMDGGSPEVVPGSVIPKEIFAGPDMAISPDGKRLAFLVGGPEQKVSKIALVPLDAGPQPAVRLVDPDPRISGAAAFLPDGKAAVYSVRENGVDNLWLQPFDGSQGRQITNFQSDQIQNFQFSPDGSVLGVFRQHTESDVVLLHDTGASSR